MYEYNKNVSAFFHLIENALDYDPNFLFLLLHLRFVSSNCIELRLLIFNEIDIKINQRLLKQSKIGNEHNGKHLIYRYLYVFLILNDTIFYFWYE